MQFTIGTITRCAGQGHYHVPVTIAGVEYPLVTSQGEVQELGGGTLEERRDQILARIRSAIREANANTFAQVRTALETKTFSV
jgi:hypothetical protein